MWMCHCCDQPYRMNLNIPNQIWVQIMPNENGGMLCPLCIAYRIEEWMNDNDFIGYINGYWDYNLVRGDDADMGTVDTRHVSVD